MPYISSTIRGFGLLDLVSGSDREWSVVVRPENSITNLKGFSDIKWEVGSIPKLVDTNIYSREIHI